MAKGSYSDTASDAWLTGKIDTEVDSREQKDLAGQLARDTGDVKDVRNLLAVDGS